MLFKSKDPRVSCYRLTAFSCLLVSQYSFMNLCQLILTNLSMGFQHRLWGTFLADIVIQMLGTDYARILRAIYAFAQIRITRTYGLLYDDHQEV